MNDILIACISSLFGFGLGVWQQWFSNRRSLLDAVVERYVADARIEPTEEVAAFRLSAMQRAGVALFTREKDIRRFFDGVVARGCVHPLKDAEWAKFLSLDKLPLLLMAANENGINLRSEGELYSFFADCITNREEQKAHEARSKSAKK